ncbi:MAG TPA: hypothetical protein VL326_03195 [Kofleriaceae bacterium]|nr:hypothetical protein [Kofleriaceae bacterium]
MKWLFVISVALVSACGDREATKLAKIRDEVCHCKTAKCADEAMARLPTKNIQSTPRARKIAREMLDCVYEVYKTNAPIDDPDAEAPNDPETSDPASARTP